MKKVFITLSCCVIGMAYADGNWQTQNLNGDHIQGYYSSLSSGTYGKNHYLIDAYLNHASYDSGGNPWGIPTFGQYIAGQFFKISVSTSTKEDTTLIPYIDENGIYYFAYIDENGHLQYGKITPELVTSNSIKTQEVGMVKVEKPVLKDAYSIFPSWYGLNQFSYAVNNNNVYMNYNVLSNETTQIESKKCNGGLCFKMPSLLNTLKDFAYFSSTSVHNGEIYVSFNERVGGGNGPIYGVVKKYNQSSSAWVGVCGGNLTAPGIVSKVLSQVFFDRIGNPIVLDYSNGVDGKINLNVLKCYNNKWIRVGNTFIVNEGVWYPQVIINSKAKNDINVVYRTEKSPGQGVVYAKAFSYSAGRWINLGVNGLVSESNALNADQQVASVQNGVIYVAYKEALAVGSTDILKPVVKKLDQINNKWDYVCNLAVHTNGDNTNVWYASGAGSFINDFAGQNFLIYNQNFENNPNQPGNNPDSGKYSVDLAMCSAN